MWHRPGVAAVYWCSGVLVLQCTARSTGVLLLELYRGVGVGGCILVLLYWCTDGFIGVMVLQWNLCVVIHWWYRSVIVPGTYLPAACVSGLFSLTQTLVWPRVRAPSRRHYKYKALSHKSHTHTAPTLNPITRSHRTTRHPHK